MIVRRHARIDAGPATSADWTDARRMARQGLAELTPEEDAAITADAQSDPDSGLLSEEEMGRARWTTFAEASGRGDDLLQLDSDVSARLRETGDDWQARANEILRRALPAA